MIDRYMDRPNATFKNGMFKIVDNLCFAKFLACYFIDYSPKDPNDCQPEILNNHINALASTIIDYPKCFPLMSSKEKLKRHQVRSVLRYYTPNRHKYPEKYAHHLLFMFFPFRSEQELLGSNNSYLAKLSESRVFYFVCENHRQFEPLGDLVDTALANMSSTINNQDSFSQQEND